MKPIEKLPFIRTLGAHEWEKYRDARLRALDDSPDAFGSTFASEQARAPDDWAWRVLNAAGSGRDYPLIAEIDDAVLGLVWAKVDAQDPSQVNLFQMWVAPESRGRGVAASLLREAIEWAKSRNARFVQLGVTCGDTAAGRLYVREGFQNFGSPEPRPGTSLSEQAMRLALDDSASG